MDKTNTTKEEKICTLCNENQSKYCCPKCEALYCSLDCYKSEKHLECSETFYRDCINEELAGHEADKESKQKMIDILSKMYKENGENPENIEEMLASLDGNGEIDDEGSCIDSDDDEYTELKDRIEGLDLNDADAIWNAMTDDERNDFEALISKGDVGTIVPQWEPWWLHHKKEKLIEDVENSTEIKIEEDALKKCPKLIEVPKLTDLTTVRPSPALKFNIINVLASYAFVTRYFNGEIEPVEWVIYLLNVCSNLDNNTNFEDPEIAVESVVQNCIQSKLIETDKDSLDVMKHDSLLILNGPSVSNKAYYCKAALSHIHSLLCQAKTMSKMKKDTEKDKSLNGFTKKFPEHQSAHLPSLDVSKVKKCIKKVEYYMSFVESYGMVTK